MQEGLNWQPCPYGGVITAKEGYHFYDTHLQDNYDEDGNLRAYEEISWCTYMTCVCNSPEEANANIICEKIEV